MSTGSSSSHGSRNENIFSYPETQAIPSISQRISRPLAMQQQLPTLKSPGLGSSGGVSASSVRVGQILIGNLSAATPFGLMFSGSMMEGVESGRSSTSGTPTIGDRETITGYSSDQEMEGNTTGSNTPNVPGYGDLKLIYAIVCDPCILPERPTGRDTPPTYSNRQADQSWCIEPHSNLQSKIFNYR